MCTVHFHQSNSTGISIRCGHLVDSMRRKIALIPFFPKKECKALKNQLVFTVLIYFAADTCLTADPGVASSIMARSHTFVEIDHEIISIRPFSSLPLIQEGLLSVTSESMYTKEKKCD